MSIAYRSLTVLLVSIVVLGFATPIPYAQPLPSNEQLLAVMPPGAESVFIQRLEELRVEQSILRNQFDDGWFRRSDELDLKSVVMNALADRSVRLFAWGGSNFRLPPDTGMTGNYNERAVYVVDRPLTDLRARLERSKGIPLASDAFTVDRFTVYSGRIAHDSFYGHAMNAADESWYIALADDFTIITAESRADIEYMLQAWARAEPEIPERWREILRGHDVSAPLFIVRRLATTEAVSGACRRLDIVGLTSNGPNRLVAASQCVACLVATMTQGYVGIWANLHLPPAVARLSEFALTLQYVDQPALRFSMTAEEIGAARAWFEREVFSPSVYDWTAEVNGGRLDATLSMNYSVEEASRLQFYLIVLFGPMIMI